jgi:hypothetical protein
VQLDVIENYFKEHWNGEIKKPGLQAVKKFRKECSTGMMLNYETAKTLKLEALFLFIGSNHLAMQIVL